MYTQEFNGDNDFISYFYITVPRLEGEAKCDIDGWQLVWYKGMYMNNLIVVINRERPCSMTTLIAVIVAEPI